MTILLCVQYLLGATTVGLALATIIFVLGVIGA